MRTLQIMYGVDQGRKKLKYQNEMLVNYRLSGYVNKLKTKKDKEMDTVYGLYSFTVNVVIVHCLKSQLKHYDLKYTLKTQSPFKTLECLRLLCHPTCFGHTLDHLQGISLVQSCFPPCCFVTILLGYVAVSSVCVVVMCTSLLLVLLCTQQYRQQRGTHDNNTYRRYGHIPK